MAELRNIFLRTGCFCNPGACQRHLKLSNTELIEHFKVNSRKNLIFILKKSKVSLPKKTDSTVCFEALFVLLYALYYSIHN